MATNKQKEHQSIVSVLNKSYDALFRSFRLTDFHAISSLISLCNAVCYIAELSKPIHGISDYDSQVSYKGLLFGIVNQVC